MFNKSKVFASQKEIRERLKEKRAERPAWRTFSPCVGSFISGAAESEQGVEKEVFKRRVSFVSGVL